MSLIVAYACFSLLPSKHKVGSNIGRWHHPFRYPRLLRSGGVDCTFQSPILKNRHISAFLWISPASNKPNHCCLFRFIFTNKFSIPTRPISAPKSHPAVPFSSLTTNAMALPPKPPLRLAVAWWLIVEFCAYFGGLGPTRRANIPTTSQNP